MNAATNNTAAETMSLDGELTIYRAAELKNQLLDAVATTCAAARPLEIDLSGVTEIDSAGVQLLMLAKREAGASLRLAAHSPAVLEVFQLLDLAAFFGDALVIDGATA